MTSREPAPATVPWALLGAALAVAVAGYGIGTASLEWFKVPGTSGSLWWPAAGACLVIIIRLPRRSWWLLLAIFGVAVAAASLHFGAFTAAVTFAVVNVIEIVVAALILQDASGSTNRRLRTPQEAVRFILAIASAVVVGAVFVALRTALVPDDGPWLDVSRAYIVNHTLGLFALAPLLLPTDSWWRPGRLRHLEFVAVLAVTVAVDLPIFSGMLPGMRAFPVLLPIVWAAIRLDPLRATIISLVTCSFAAYGTAHGVGAFAGIGSPTARSLVTQFFIATVTITALVLVMITRHRARLVERIADSEKTLKIALQEALVGIYSMRLDTGNPRAIIDVNTAMCLMLGYEEADLIGQPGRLLGVPDDVEEKMAIESRLDQLAAGTVDAFQRETRLRTAAGEELWVQLSATRVTPRTAPPFALVYVHDLTTREQNKRMLETMALHDALTGLPNRSVLFPRLETLLRRTAVQRSLVGLLYLDLDGFKPVNDTHGHAAGDAVLVEVARRLGEAVRRGDTVARLGGDEFAIIAADIESEADLDVICGKIRDELLTPIELPGGALVTIGTSIGTAVGTPGMTADELVRVADASMYRVKHGIGVGGAPETGDPAGGARLARAVARDDPNPGAADALRAGAAE